MSRGDARGAIDARGDVVVVILSGGRHCVTSDMSRTASSSVASSARAASTPRRGARRACARPRCATSSERASSEEASTTMRLLSFNVLCPEYKRASTGDGRESDDFPRAMARTKALIELVLAADVDVACVQEFWHASREVSRAWVDALSAAGYATRITKRTNGRCDGLLTAVKTSTFEVLDVRDVLFNDCGDRVACVSRVRRRGLEALVVNTHLLFPHNANSSLIRLREVFKILEYVKSMMEEPEMAGRKVPVIITGDFNGSNRGRVYRFLTSQGFVNALDSCQLRDGCETPWVSHLNHHNECVGVDHMMLLNPSNQVFKIGASWKEAVFAMIRAKIVENGIVDDVAAFAAFDENADGSLSKQEFVEFANKIGLCGEKSPGLLNDELDEIFDACDDDGNSMIDFQEFVRRMDIAGMARSLADPNLSFDIGDYMANSASDQVVLPLTESWDEQREALDLEIECASLPANMLDGRWPEKGQFDLSDHGPLLGQFRLRSDS